MQENTQMRNLEYRYCKKTKNLMYIKTDFKQNCETMYWLQNKEFFLLPTQILLEINSGKFLILKRLRVNFHNFLTGLNMFYALTYKRVK